MSVGGIFREHFLRARQESIYVILGVQGSGTNLLRSLLDRAFNFSVVQDQALVYNAARTLGLHPSADAVTREFQRLLPRMLPTVLSRKALRRIKTNASFNGIEGAFDPGLITTGEDFARFIYAYSAYARGSLRMAIKSDDLWETIGDIDRVLPNRRIVLLTRDFRDNLLSITNKDFGPRDPLVAAEYVKRRFAHYDAEYQRTPPERRFHVRYEDLLDDPVGFVQRFNVHFGLGAGGEEPLPVDTGRIRSQNKRKWATLSRRQLTYVEAMLREDLRRYGYETETAADALPGRGAWMMARVHDTVSRVPQKLAKIASRLAK